MSSEKSRTRAVVEVPLCPQDIWTPLFWTPTRFRVLFRRSGPCEAGRVIERSAEALQVLRALARPTWAGSALRTRVSAARSLRRGGSGDGLCFGVPVRRRTRRSGRELLLASAGTFGRVGARARAGVEVDQWLRVGPDGGQASSPAGWTDALPERGSERSNRLNSARRAESRDALARQRRGDWRKPSSMLAAASHGPQARRARKAEGRSAARSGR
jgi:hypothetical protein